MKKILTTLIALFVTATFLANCYAQSLLLTYDGKVHTYLGNILKLKVNNELVKTDIPPVIISNRSLVPARAVFEKLGAKVNWDAKNRKVLVAMTDTNLELKINDTNAKVNNKTVKMDVPAKIINDRTMIPLRFVGEQLDMIVGWHPEDSMVTIENKQETISSKLEGVSCQKVNNIDKVTINVKNYKGYNIFRLSSPERIVIDIPYTSVAEKNRINVNSSIVKAIRYAQFEDATARIVLDVNSQAQYTVEENPGKLVINLQSTSQETVVEDNTGNVTSTEDDLKIDCKAASDGDEIAINLKSFKDYNVFRLTDSERIVMDIKGARIKDVDEHRIDYRSDLIRSVRYSNFGSDSLRVVLDTHGQPDYNVSDKSGKITFNVKNPTYKNIIYHNNADRVHLTLGGAALTDGGEELKKFYTEKTEAGGRKHTITFASNLADLGSGVMKINDSLLESIEISNDSAKQQTSITFNAKDEYFYEVMARSSVDDTAITIFKPARKRDKLVVIDAGHGGRETGAIYGSLYEKDLNLDIAKRVNELLRKKNVNTYMIREDDSYVALYERAYIANDMNATLFLSIHNNALTNPDYGGTMTLYYPQRSNDRGLTGKRFAQIIQAKLLAKLGTTDRKIIERPNLVVLKATTMPSALAEIAFMTNKPDRENLQKEEFRQKAAEALCDSVIQALNETE